MPSATVPDSDPPASADRPVGFGARAAAFLATGATIALLAIDHGAYDVVVRQRFAIVLWWVLALAVVAGLLPRTRPARSGAVAVLALAGLAVWTAVSLGWTSSDEKTVVEISRVLAHLGVLALVASALGPETWRAGIAGASAAAACVCVVAFGARLDPGLFGTDRAAGAFGASRLSAPFGYWNSLGAWAVMTSALCLGWAAHARSGLWRAAALAVVPLAVVTGYLTYSRASLADTAVAAVVLLAFSRNRWTLAINGLAAGAGAGAAVLAARHAEQIASGTGTAGAGGVLAVVLAAAGVAALVAWATQRLGLDDRRLPRGAARVTLAVTLAVAGIGAVVASLTVLPDAWRQFKEPHLEQTADPTSRLKSLSGNRYQLYKVDVDMFADHPLKGTGAGTYEFHWNRRGTLPDFIRDGHSLFLESLAELGLIGLALVLALVAAAIAALRRAMLRVRDPADRGVLAGAAAALGAYVVAASVDWMWESTAVTVLALTLIGGAIAAGGTAARPLGRSVRLALVLAAVVAGVVQLPGLVSTSEIRKSQTAIERGDVAGALGHAGDAIDAQPWAASPLIQRALVEEQSARLDAARSDLAAAAQREPENWRIPLILARVEARRGDDAAALAAYRRARALRPHGLFFRAG